MGKHAKWSFKSQKGGGHVFNMATPCQTAESVCISPVLMHLLHLTMPSPFAMAIITPFCKILVYAHNNRYKIFFMI